MKNRIFFLFIALLFAQAGISQQLENLNIIEIKNLRKVRARHEIKIPNILGYNTLKCDFHIHTLFSDGTVWPTTRVDEAWLEGLDAIAITDHIENQPKNKSLVGDNNTSFDLAVDIAKEREIILIRGGEISRHMPPGHLNAIFLKDVNAVDLPDFNDAINEAVKQGAFVFWNHPGWKRHQPDTCKMFPIHQELIKSGKIKGIEVFNAKDWYPVALGWCLEYGLTMMGNSDIHGIVSHTYDLENDHSPITLVFTEGKDENSIKEALFAGRTAIYYGDNMIGKTEFLDAIFKASVTIEKTGVADSKGRMIYNVKNSSCIPFYLEDSKGEKMTVPADSSSILYFNEGGKYNIKVTNLTTGIGNCLEVSLDF